MCFTYNSCFKITKENEGPICFLEWKVSNHEMHPCQYDYHTPGLTYVLDIFKKSVYFLITEINYLQKILPSCLAFRLAAKFSEHVNNYLFLLLRR